MPPKTARLCPFSAENFPGAWVRVPAAGRRGNGLMGRARQVLGINHSKCGSYSRRLQAAAHFPSTPDAPDPLSGVPRPIPGTPGRSGDVASSLCCVGYRVPFISGQCTTKNSLRKEKAGAALPAPWPAPCVGSRVGTVACLPASLWDTHDLGSVVAVGLLLFALWTCSQSKFHSCIGNK